MTSEVLPHNDERREAQRAQANQAELVERIAQQLRHDGTREPLPGVHLFRVSQRPAEANHGVMEPAFCIVAQGSKEVFLGPNRYQYDPAHYLLVAVGLPIVSQIIAASPEEPYLSLRLDLDLTLLGSLMVETGPAMHSRGDLRAIGVSALDGGLLDAVVRLARLFDSPAEARYLAPLVTREILYRLLLGEQGDLLRQIAVEDGHTQRVVQAIARLRTDFDQPLRIEELARDLGMSVSGFHHHFKAVTGLSPLQFQKRQRLQTARRLMLGEHLDAASTAFRVGYDDASQFNREYKRLFGLPPMRDVERLRSSAPPDRRFAAD